MVNNSKNTLYSFAIKRPSIVLGCLVLLSGYILQTFVAVYVVTSVQDLDRHIVTLKEDHIFYNRVIAELKHDSKLQGVRLDRLESNFNTYLMLTTSRQRK